MDTKLQQLIDKKSKLLSDITRIVNEIGLTDKEINFHLLSGTQVTKEKSESKVMPISNVVGIVCGTQVQASENFKYSHQVLEATNKDIVLGGGCLHDYNEIKNFETFAIIPNMKLIFFYKITSSKAVQGKEIKSLIARIILSMNLSFIPLENRILILMYQKGLYESEIVFEDASEIPVRIIFHTFLQDGSVELVPKIETLSKFLNS
jgi:hypothetical protein